MNNEVLIKNARETLANAIAPLVERGVPYALLDFPNYWNVGDSAIWLGAERLLRDLTGAGPAYVSSLRNFDSEQCRREIKGGPIFLQGGGNFGDIYPHHQLFRDQILGKFRDHRIVILPQTIQYRDHVSAASTAEALHAHPDTTLFVRDRASVDLAMTSLNFVSKLVPDAAFGLGALPRIGVARAAVLLHLRQDVEKAVRDDSVFDQLPSRLTRDWPKESRESRLVMTTLAEAGALLSGRCRPVDRRIARYQSLARMRLKRGITILSSGRQVITDRLHGHIMCTLLGVPHVALDNDYGKVHAYIAAWTADMNSVTRASSSVEAVAALSALPS